MPALVANQNPKCKDLNWVEPQEVSSEKRPGLMSFLMHAISMLRYV